jgi:uncharacterized membrane protein
MTETPQPQYESATGCLIRIYWNLLGPGLLFVAGAAGVANRPRLGSVWDAVLAAILISLVAARFLDRGKTPVPAADAGPSRGVYAAAAVAAAGVIFTVVHGVIPWIFP